uniref:Sugar transporter n=1 Tax=Dianthus spiculifolius TaxID=1268176 RepID=A0A3Q9VAN3_9CARY|nr:sugar transporter [Dianthus spiculifolius]
MEDISFIIGVIGNVISALLFLSPAKTFIRIVGNKSTEEFESFPYIATLLSASIWTYYGIIKPGAILVSTVNGFGALVQLVYVTLFLIFAPSSKKATTAMWVVIVDVGCLGAILSISWFLMNEDMRINVIGLIGAALNIVMYGSPLSALGTVLRSKSVEYMPFLLSLCVFLNGGVWTIYALLVKDPFLGVPNAAGFILGAIQLAVYAKYRKSSNDKQSYEPLIESSIP